MLDCGLILGTTLLAAAAAGDSVDVPRSARVVRRLEEVVVRASPLHDVLSSQSVHVVNRAALRELPLDDLAGVLALRAGVVAEGGALHVRGGRIGDSQWQLRGIPLTEALRGRAMELPRLAIETVEIVSGGLDPEYGNAVAGVMVVRTIDPRPKPEAVARWETDAGYDFEGNSRVTQYDRLSGRYAGPLLGGLGLVAAADVMWDDTHLPALRTRSSARSWRADNRMLGLLKFAPLGTTAPVALEIFGSRRVDRPYSPMWSLDGYTTLCSGPLCAGGPSFTADSTEAASLGYRRYRAADHAVVTDDRRLAVVLSAWRPLGAGRLRGAAGWVAMDRLTALGGSDDESSVLDGSRAPFFGYEESPYSDPIYVYWGDEPFYQKARAQTLTLRSDYDLAPRSGNRLGVGAGLTLDRVRMREIDTSARMLGIDSLRAFDTSAPGGFVYAQGRWIREGLVLNGGLRLEAFTAGDDAADQTYGAPARTHITLSPRFGVAYPVSVRDVLSLAYVRVQQNPGRDYLYENREYIGHRQPLGNPALEPTTLVSYQAALKHVFDRGRAVQAAFFYRDLFGQIGAREYRNPFGGRVARYENADKGNAQGVEVSLFLPADPGLSLEAQYTFMHAVGTQSLEDGVPFGSRFGNRIESLGDYPLNWDRRHSLSLVTTWRHVPRTPSRPPRGPLEFLARGLRGPASVVAVTQLGSGLPWTPSPRHVSAEFTDPAITNSRRFDWQERTHLAARWSPLLLGRRVTFGIDVRNLFDFRADRVATIYGYPHPWFNTFYDDYGAHRGETGLPGGAYWDSDDTAVADAWVRVHDPRLAEPPRLVRFSLETSW